MARRFTQPFMCDFIGRSNRALWCAAETPKNQDTAQSFQRTLQAGHCLIAPGPADLRVGFRTVAIVTPTDRWSLLQTCPWYINIMKPNVTSAANRMRLSVHPLKSPPTARRCTATLSRPSSSRNLYGVTDSYSRPAIPSPVEFWILTGLIYFGCIVGFGCVVLTLIVVRALSGSCGGPSAEGGL